jgi:hypothetical protein
MYPLLLDFFPAFCAVTEYLHFMFQGMKTVMPGHLFLILLNFRAIEFNGLTAFLAHQVVMMVMVVGMFKMGNPVPEIGLPGQAVPGQ